MENFKLKKSDLVVAWGDNVFSKVTEFFKKFVNSNSLLLVN